MKKPVIICNQYSPFMIADHDEIVTLEKNLPLSRVTSLCRCGDSSAKPYCDGSHTKNGFSGQRSIPCQKKQKNFERSDQSLIVFFDSTLCAHIEECVKGLPAVFDTNSKPWINPNNADINEIIEVIQRCPSGALTYQVAGEPISESWSETPSIKTLSNGPYCISQMTLIDDQETDILINDDHYVLCRCGKSRKKPLCDGSHHKKPFEE